ncbi:MAG: phosphoribosylglycinamide formyltransferase [Fusobacteriota bacterium]
MNKKLNIAILASGNGSNFQAINDNIKKGKIKKGKIKILISNKKSAYVLERAKKENIEALYLDRSNYKSREDYDKKIVKILKEKDIDLVVLAGYMMWISDFFVDNFKNKILNIHPSLLPAFKGLDAIQRAYNYGVKLTGVTVHFVDKSKDGGPIVLQKSLEISNEDTLSTLEEKIHIIEHQLYSKAINLFCHNNIQVEGRKVIISE